MRVRHPDFDFTGVSPIWAENVDAAHMTNATGIVPAYIEPFLIKVMRRAKAELDPVDHADLIRDIDVFNKQEAQHFKFHAALNTWVRENGYEGMAEHERSYEAEYDQMLRTRSLKWLVAYCEGFEAMGLATAQRFVDGDFEADLGKADPRVIALWKWHLAEEYEHRNVVYQVLKTLYGRNRVSFYLLRISGFFNASRHIGANVSRLQRYLMRTYRDREGIPAPAKTKPSLAQLGQLRQLTGIISVLSPTYDPADKPRPVHLDDVLGAYT